MTQILASTIFALLLAIAGFLFIKPKRFLLPMQFSDSIWIGLNATLILLLNAEESKVFNLANSIYCFGLITIGWFMVNSQFLSYQNGNTSKSNIGALIQALGINVVEKVDLRTSSLVGDWLILFGLSLASRSISYSVGVIVFYPISLLLISNMFEHSSRKKPASRLTGPCSSSLLFPMINIFARSLTLIFFAFVLAKILSREWPLFFGSENEAREFLTLLLQIEVTVGAILVALLFLLLEVSFSAYSPGIINSLVKIWQFKLVVSWALTSWTIKILMLGNHKLLGNIGQFADTSLIMDGQILLSLGLGLSYASFARLAISFLASPEKVILEALKSLDKKWFSVVRHDWGQKDLSQISFLKEDSIFIIQGVLLNSLKKGDVKSFQTGIKALQSRLKELKNEIDGPLLDDYLAFHFSPIVLVSKEQHSEIGFASLVSLANELTNARIEAVLDFENYLKSDMPPGDMFIRKILMAAFEADVKSEVKNATEVLLARVLRIIHTLEDGNLSSKNDTRLRKSRNSSESWALGILNFSYIGYFENLSDLAIRSSSRSMLWIFTDCLSRIFTEIVHTIHEGSPQLLYLLYLLKAYEHIVLRACERGIASAISFPEFSLQIDVPNAEKADIVARYFCRFLNEYASTDMLDIHSFLALTDILDNLALANDDAAKEIISVYDDIANIISGSQRYQTSGWKEGFLEDLAGSTNMINKHLIE